MRAVVTGAAGFIGSTLVDRLVADGHQVVGIDDLRTGIAATLERALSCNGLSPARFTFVRVDIQAPELTDIVAGSNPNVIFHLAAQVHLRASVADPEFDARSSVLGLRGVRDGTRVLRTRPSRRDDRSARAVSTRGPTGPRVASWGRRRIAGVMEEGKP
jgi:UDP-glucose 4-epimerase